MNIMVVAVKRKMVYFYVFDKFENEIRRFNLSKEHLGCQEKPPVSQNKNVFYNRNNDDEDNVKEPIKINNQATCNRP